MLNIRPPDRPPRSWKDFFLQIATVSIGLLIAIGLQSLAETIHWRMQVSEGRAQLREEIRIDEPVYRHRDEVSACIRDSLADLKALVGMLQARKPVRPVAELITPLNGPVRHEIWNSLNSAQVLAHFPKDELALYSEFYANVQDAEYFMDRESRAWRQLHLLEGDPTLLTQQEINQVKLALGEAEEMGAGVAFLSRRQIDLAGVLGLGIAKEDRSSQRECSKRPAS